MSIPAKRTMVCVTVQKNCERLIREGAKIAGGEGLRVVHVAKNGAKLLGGGDDSEALEYLFRISREYGAEMDVLRAEETVETIVELAKRNDIQCLVVGAGGGRGEHDFATLLRVRLQGVAVVIVA